MQEPSLRTSRLAIAGGIVAAIVIGTGGFLIGRATTERAPVRAAPPVVPASVAPPPSATVAPALLSRAELIALAAVAADAEAGGRDIGDQLNSVVGRRFELRLPFGCEGASGTQDEDNFRWHYDAESSTLRVQAAPVFWKPTDWWALRPPAQVAAIEGFWIERPWTTSEACPAGSVPPIAAVPRSLEENRQILALGQVFSPESPRRARRAGQPYKVTQRIAEGQLDFSKGFRLRLSGRIAALPESGGSVRCLQLDGPDQQPTCLIGMMLDQVAIETGATGDVIATWDATASDMLVANVGS